MADVFNLSKDELIHRLKARIRMLEQQVEMQKRMLADDVKLINYQKQKLDRYEDQSAVVRIPFCGVVQ